MKRTVLFLVGGLLVSVLLATPGLAAADSIVYERDGNIWQAAPDGSNQRQVTTTGGYSKPTQANDGTIVAVKNQLLQRINRGGGTLNTAGDSDWGGPLNTSLSPNGQLVAYDYFRTGTSLSPGFHTSLSDSTRPTDHGEVFDISGWGRPSWIGNGRVLMFDASETFTGDTLIYTLGGSGTQPWYEDPDLSLSGGEIDASQTRFVATDSVKIRIYRLSAPPPAIAVEPRCDVTGPNGSFFRPTWSPDGSALAWQEDDGIWVGRFDLTTCQGTASLVIPGGKAPDWGPADVTSPGPGPNPPIETKIDKAKVNQKKRRANFTFSSNKAGSTFICKIDKKSFKNCASPKTYKKLKPGKHKFKVAGIDKAGNADQTPAVAKFKIKR